MHTEDEAKKLWCPHTRLSALDEQDVTPAANRFSVVNIEEVLTSTCNCLASGCSQWRWLPQLWQFRGMGGQGGTYTETKPKDGYGREGKKLPQQGYCGLAGKP